MKNIQTTACTKNNQTMISIDKHVIPGKCLGTSIGRRARENIQTSENAGKPLERRTQKHSQNRSRYEKIIKSSATVFVREKQPTEGKRKSPSQRNLKIDLVILICNVNSFQLFTQHL